MTIVGLEGIIIAWPALAELETRHGGRVFLDARQAKNDGSYSVGVYAGRAPTSTGVTIPDSANPLYRPSVNALGFGVP